MQHVMNVEQPGDIVRSVTSALVEPSNGQITLVTQPQADALRECRPVRIRPPSHNFSKGTRERGFARSMM